MVGWLHPYAEEDSGLGYLDNGDIEPSSERPELVREYSLRCGRLRQHFVSQGVETVEWSRAYHISEASGESLLPTVDEEEFRSARLVHFFEELPSPANLRGRSVIFVQMWAVEGPVSAARERLAEVGKRYTGTGKLYLDVRRTPGTDACFLLASVEYAPPHDVSTLAFVEGRLGDVRADLRAIREGVCSVWPNADVATRRFWAKEIGLFR